VNSGHLPQDKLFLKAVRLAIGADRDRLARSYDQGSTPDHARQRSFSIVIELFAADGRHVASSYGAPPPNSDALRPFHISMPYALELNPIENVWEYLRGNKLAITVFDDYDDIVDKACDAWNFFEQDPNRIASITTRTWATVNN
jgi:hypothetical protein